MEIRFVTDERTGKDLLMVDHARIIFRNFEGRPDKYNRQGGRPNFSIPIDDPDLAQELINRGWNVTIRTPKVEGDEVRMHLKVKVSFNAYGPKCHLISGSNHVELNEDSIGCLDGMDIADACMDLRPYDWKDEDGNTGRTAYLKNLEVVQNLDRFSARYSDADALMPGC